MRKEKRQSSKRDGVCFGKLGLLTCLMYPRSCTCYSGRGIKYLVDIKHP